jgi:MFS family permease
MNVSGARVRDLLRGNVLWLSLVSLLNDTASEMIYPLLPFFLVTTLGAGTAVLGAIEGAAESASSLVKLIGGWFSDRFGRRPLVTAGYGIAGAVRPILALSTAPWHVLALRLGDRFGKGIRSAPRDALLAESVAANRRGTAFGIHRAADHLGAAIGPLIAAALLLAWPGQIRRVFAIAAIPGIVGALLVVWKVRETHTTAGEQPRAPEHSGAPFDPAFFRYLAVLLLFTLGNASDAFLLLRASELGVPMAAVPLLWSVHHVGKSLLSVPGGMFADRLGPRRAIAGGWLVYAAVYAAFAFAGEAWHAWALFVVYGIFHALTEAPEKALVAALAPAGRRGAAFGAYHGAIGVAALPASMIFGLLWARFGPAVPFLTGAALALAATLLLPITRTPAESSQ